MFINRKHLRYPKRRFPGWQLLTALLLVATLVSPLQAAPENSSHWTATWTASPQARWDGDFGLPTHLPFNLWNETIRQVARVSIGGSQVRVVLSNAYGKRPLKIGAAHIALTDDGASIVDGSGRVLTFGGQPSVTIPAGVPVISDPVQFDVEALDRLSVSLYLPQPTPPATFHWAAQQTAYVGAGNQVAAETIDVKNTLSTRVFLTRILVDAPADTRTVVAFGDSITDGVGSSMNADHRWPDYLAERLAEQGVAVLNAGIAGARLLHDKMGEDALSRFQRDVLGQPGVDGVIVLMGINDISWHGTPLAPDDAPIPEAEALIRAYKQLIAQAHTHGVRIIGATLTPFKGALEDTPMADYYSAEKERVRQTVNQWIRNSGAFDAVVDFDKLLRDPNQPKRILPAYDSGDHLHPGDLGYQTMAHAIDLRTLFDRDVARNVKANSQ